ncbi:DUF4251 domain-containing protein [Chitinophaga sp. SYP-B3965]|uniref:DUF4251 domain-containing protein n=1 Tax=Chitinophaga sp. SYP-B3965 TaxID=2663120 RepID=UPI001563786A
MNIVRSMLCACAFLILTVTFSKAQSPQHKDSLIANTIKALLDKHTFRFFVQSVVPPGGQTTSVPGENYTFRVQGDSLHVNLPYYGRSTNAYADNSQIGFTFKWGQFDYKLEEKKKGWNITFRRRNSPDISYMVLNVLRSGVATLYVEPRNKQPISYMGNIIE